MADIVLLFVLKGRDCMSKVLIEVLVIILIAGSYLILYSAVRVSAIADQRIAEIQKRETFDKEKQLNTNQSSISGGMVMANTRLPPLCQKPLFLAHLVLTFYTVVLIIGIAIFMMGSPEDYNSIKSQKKNDGIFGGDR